jgi:pyruvate/2-oxoglutarate dehydrogenase complex dihydrolipoamide dehydrogenase (E3) component
MNQASHNFDYDAVVIGGGSGGFAAARTLTDEGAKTAVIEGGGQLGGLCILRGCMPTKALLYAAEVYHLMKHCGTWGLQCNDPGFQFREVIKRKDQLIKEFANYRAEQLENGKFDLIRETARFLDPHTLELSDGRQLTSAHFVISTGSVVSPPPIKALESVGYITSDEALCMEQPPNSMIVLGGGPIALEFAQFFSRLDVAVHLIQRNRQVLKTMDSDLTTELVNSLKDEGMHVYTGAEILTASTTEHEKKIQIRHQGNTLTIRAESILMALGRSPNTGSLNLKATGVKTIRNRIETDTSMRTATPHIFAAGDCTGPHEIVHIAIQQGEIAAANILNPDKSAAIDYRLLSSIVFTDPQLAMVGMTEKQAKDAGIPILTASYPFNDHGKSMIMDTHHGIVKLIAHRETGEILGGGVTGPLGGELIHEIIVAMHHRTTVQQFAAIPHYHPTLSEIWTYPAEELADQVTASDA